MKGRIDPQRFTSFVQKTPCIPEGTATTIIPMPARQVWLDSCQQLLRGSASTIGYGTDVLQGLLGDRLNPGARAALSLLHARTMTLQRDISRVTRLMRYLDGTPTPGDMPADGHLAGIIRQMMDETGMASRRRMVVEGWQHGGRRVPARVALDAIHPVIENALVHGRGKVLVKLHPQSGCNPWLTVLDSGPGIAKDQASRGLDPLNCGPLTGPRGSLQLGLATAQLAAHAIGLTWKLGAQATVSSIFVLQPIDRQASPTA